ncbi:hypothetical protein HPB50_021701 [Hyalomma asiaticum]|uniref:Uncharacterized protein n=1 Tax=Hyalomma asiaticum TaxID=266040 RepID=A0ACB7TBE2_HYAAI|nr:hypothetical protein HPB50_021701 [Hyalomma asiaticum]
MSNAFCDDLRIPFSRQPSPMPLPKTAGDIQPELLDTSAVLAGGRNPMNPALDVCGRPRRGTAGYQACSADLSSRGTASSPCITDGPGFSREHQPLLMFEAEAAMAQEGADDKARNTPQYFLIGIISAGLVVAAVSATANSSGGPLAPHDLLLAEEGQPAHHQQRHSYDVPRDVQDQALLVFAAPSAGRQPQPVVASSSANWTRDGLGYSAGAKSADLKKPAQHLGQLKSPGPDRYAGEKCRRYNYTYCSHPVPLFHYDPELRVCLPTSDSGSQLCNHGSNSRDVVGIFWYFDGSACATWDFPRGNCPRSYRGVDKTLRECSRQCEGKRVEVDPTRCGDPELGECDLGHLKYSYFADMRSEGSVRCANASRASLMARRRSCSEEEETPSAMSNAFCDDLSIPSRREPSPTPLLTTAGNMQPELLDTSVAAAGPRHPMKPASDTCGRPRRAAAGYQPCSADLSNSGTAGSSPVLQAHTVAANDAPEFAAASADNAAPTAQDSSREHQPLLMPEPEGADHKARNRLQYFLIGILFAGLVVAAVSAAANSPAGPLAPHDLLLDEEGQPAHHQQRRSYEYVPRDVQDQELLVVAAPSAGQQPQPVIASSSANGTRDGLVNSAGARSADRKMPAQHLGQLESPGPDRYVGEECRRYYYTYCSHPVPLFHYDPERRVCLPTSNSGSQLCNHGSNSRDVVGTFWYFDGSACTTWEFPRGNCPQNYRGVYKTLRECSRQCEGKRVEVDPTRCGVPGLGACDLGHLKYPYFADMQAEGSARCANASRASLLARRCLVGSNQFHSLEACQSACMARFSLKDRDSDMLDDIDFNT